MAEVGLHVACAGAPQVGDLGEQRVVGGVAGEAHRTAARRVQRRHILQYTAAVTIQISSLAQLVDRVDKIFIFVREIGDQARVIGSDTAKRLVHIEPFHTPVARRVDHDVPAVVGARPAQRLAAAVIIEVVHLDISAIAQCAQVKIKLLALRAPAFAAAGEEHLVGLHTPFHRHGALLDLEAHRDGRAPGSGGSIRRLERLCRVLQCQDQLARERKLSAVRPGPKAVA